MIIMLLHVHNRAKQLNGSVLAFYFASVPVREKGDGGFSLLICLLLIKARKTVTMFMFCFNFL